MDGELAYVNTDILLEPSYNYNSTQLAFCNFVVNHDVMNCTTRSSKYDLAFISLQFSVEL